MQLAFRRRLTQRGGLVIARTFLVLLWLIRRPSRNGPSQLSNNLSIRAPTKKIMLQTNNGKLTWLGKEVPPEGGSVLIKREAKI